MLAGQTCMISREQSLLTLATCEEVTFNIFPSYRSNKQGVGVVIARRHAYRYYAVYIRPSLELQWLCCRT